MELVQRSTLDSEGGGSIGRGRSRSRSPSEAWWSEGKSICVRVKSHDEEYWEFILMPVNCLKQCHILQKTINRNRKNKKRNKIENHSLHHSSPFHLVLPKISIEELYEGVYDASWVVLGSLIYFFGAIGEPSTDQIYYLRRNLDGTFPASMSVRKAGCLICGRRQPKVVSVDGKVYVFGDSDDVFGEVFEPYRDSFEGQSRPLSSPVSSSAHADVLFAVPIDNESKIVVGLKILGSEATVVFVYDVTTDSWVKHNTTGFSFNLRSSLCPPIAVDNCLYWLDTKMRAYDLDTRQWFEGPIEDDMFQHILETPVDLQLSLVHLDGDRFCITWVDYHDTTVLHYTTIQVFRTTTRIQGNRFHLRATVFSCESFTSTLSLCLGDRALILGSSANVIKKDGDQSFEEAGQKKKKKKKGDGIANVVAVTNAVESEEAAMKKKKKKGDGIDNVVAVTNAVESEEAAVKKKKKKKKGDGIDNVVVVTNPVESEEAAVKKKKKKKKKGDGIDNVVAVTNAVESEEAAVKKKKKKRKGDGIDNFVAVINAVESEEAAVKKKKKKKKGDGIDNVVAVTNPVDLKTKRKSKEASDLVDEKADKGETVPTKDKTEEKEVSEMVENEGIEKEKKESKKRRKGRRKNPWKEVDNEGVEEEKKESKKRKTSELNNENDVFNFLKKMKKKKSIDLLHHTIDFSSGDEE